jgi:uncharacterized repeat protein (TIGR03803 family)
MPRGYPVGEVRLIALSCLIALVATSGPVNAQATFQTLYNFQGSSSGDGPNGGLIFDASGALYGTTFDGGNAGCPLFGNADNGCGTVFKLTPPATPNGTWTETVLYRFTGGSDGGNPTGSLIIDVSGVLYGTAIAGGKSGCSDIAFNGGGCGTVFKLTPPIIPGAWTESVLHTFTGGSGGYSPNSVIFGAAGVIYGTTSVGGDVSCNRGAGCGTVFKLTPPVTPGGMWVGSVLYTFTGGSDGGFPSGSLALDAAGALYGTASSGGSLSCNDGTGCGTVFKLTPAISPGAWTESVLHTFTGGSDSAFPSAGVILDATGVLYGTTSGGGNPGCVLGAGGGCGTVFKLTPPATPGGTWAETLLYDFTGSGLGVSPNAMIFDATGALYGTTANGGDLGTGTVFKLTPPATPGGTWTENTLHTFSGGSDGGGPNGSLLFDVAGALYGAATGGGSCCGTVFKVGNSPLADKHDTSDFNGDSHSDILWQNTTSRQVAIWEMNGTSVIGGGNLGDPGPGWQVIATGDFNGDGYSDILWQNTSGEVAIWEMNGTSVIGGSSLGFPGPGWQIIATGDFNGDGHSGILWQNTTNRQVAIWEMNGTAVIGGSNLGDPGPGWQVIATGDFNGDGHSDILWQNTSGEVAIWEMNGTSVIGGGSLGFPGPGWHPIGK